MGILFAEQPVGRYGSALPSDAQRSFGAAVGYQKFLDPALRKQIIFEVGGREGTDRQRRGQAAAGTRYQQAFGQHTVLQLDLFGAMNESEGASYGSRVEFRVEF